MAMTIKCEHGLTVKKTEGELKIIYDNTTLMFYDWHRVRELIVQIYTINGNECNEGEQTKCFIELITDKNAGYVFQYPYSLRHMMLEDYDLLKKILEPYMVSTNRTLQ